MAQRPSPVYKENVKVCIRTRPTGRFAEGNLRLGADRRHIDVHIPKAQGLHINNQQEDWAFDYDNVLHNASQDAVYDDCAADIVASAVDGYSGTIMAYGQTGAGKTYTMLGNTAAYAQRGIIPRALEDVFRHIANRPDTAYQVTVSYLEIYNETYFDLLDPQCRQLSDLAVRDNEHGAVVVKGLTTTIVTTEEEALQCLFRGESNRAVSRHDMNAASSRSHCIFTVAIESCSRVESSEKRTLSKLNLVDLAGSERVGKTNSTGATLTEARYINKSLSFLEQVVVALADRARDHVPFRQNKLTNVLRDSLGGNCKTRLIANVRCEAVHLDETVSTLRFAARMMRVVTYASRVEAADEGLLLAKLQKRVRALERELAMHDTLANRGSSVNYDNYTPEEQAEVAATVRAFVHGNIPQIDITTLRHAHEVTLQFRSMVHALTAQLESANRSVASLSAGGAVPGAISSNSNSNGGSGNGFGGTLSLSTTASLGGSDSANAATAAPAPLGSPVPAAPTAAAPAAGGAAAVGTAAASANRGSAGGAGGTPSSTTRAVRGGGGGAGGRGSAASASAAAAQAEAAAAAQAAADAEAARVALAQRTVNVGHLTSGDSGFHMGIASSNAKPTNPSDVRALQQNTPRIGYTLVNAGNSSASGNAGGLGVQSRGGLASAGAATLGGADSKRGFATTTVGGPASAAAYGGNGSANVTAQPPSGAAFNATANNSSGNAAALSTQSEDEAFLEFRQGPGAALNAAFLARRRDYDAHKDAAAAAAQRMNAVKALVDGVNRRIVAKRAARGAAPDGAVAAAAGWGDDGLGVVVIDEEEYALIREAKELKQQYAAADTERQRSAALAMSARTAANNAKVALARAFMTAYQAANANGGGAFGATDALDGLASSFDDTLSLTAHGFPAHSSSASASALDGLDVGEQFDLLERERVMEAEPGSLGFYGAQKAVFGATGGRGGSTEAAMRRTRTKQAAQRFKL